MLGVLKRWLLQPIARLLNLKVQENQGTILASNCVSSVLFAYGNAMICKTVISSLPPQWISFEAMWYCFTSLVIGAMWKGSVRSAVLRNFALFAAVESLAAFSLSAYLVFVHFNVWVFAICSLMYSSLVSQFVGKSIMAFKAALWQDRAREDYDNTQSVVHSILTMAGFGVSAIFMPPLEVALIAWGLACLMDDIGWILTYVRTKPKILKSV